MDNKKIYKIFNKHSFQVIEFYDSIGSTNDRAMNIANSSDITLGIVFADYQTMCRGRTNRKWEMPPGSGLAFSVILGNCAAKENVLGRMTGIGALAVAMSVEELTGLPTKIKWPNDVLLKNKKFCGILAEGNWIGNDLNYLILGIGLNIFKGAIPGKTNFPATAIENEYSGKVNRIELLDQIISNLLKLLEVDKSDQIIKELEERLAFRGEQVQIKNNDRVICSGELLGLDDKGGLIIKTGEDQKKNFYYGDLHLIVDL